MDPADNHIVVWCGRPTTSPESNNAAFMFSVNGFLEWGPGGPGMANDQDVSLGRMGPGAISIQNYFTAPNLPSPSPDAFRVNKPSAALGPQGEVVLGVDTQNGRVRINGNDQGATLTVNGKTAGETAIKVIHIAETQEALGTAKSGDSILRFVALADGTLKWGGGSAAPDTSLFRSAADTLRTPDSLIVDGNLTVSGTKSSVAELEDGRKVALYALESPENWFEDFGCGQLDNGAAWVPLDTTFRETVNCEMSYHVFLTPSGDCQGLYVAEKTARGFEVRELRSGKSRVAFDYRVVARRRGFEAVRLEEMLAGALVNR
jgi:hypothetical protein